ncbi:hypothetical protein AACH00_19445, partial [Ideonella sp. LYT19W]
RCSCTKRTARSRTSGENLFDLFMAPSSQELEPPENPGRFKEALHVRRELGLANFSELDALFNYVYWKEDEDDDVDA